MSDFSLAPAWQRKDSAANPPGIATAQFTKNESAAGANSTSLSARLSKWESGGQPPRALPGGHLIPPAASHLTGRHMCTWGVRSSSLWQQWVCAQGGGLPCACAGALSSPCTRACSQILSRMPLATVLFERSRFGHDGLGPSWGNSFTALRGGAGAGGGEAKN
eukprot:1144187-Pelagomonas_calceolata.AAC.5